MNAPFFSVFLYKLFQKCLSPVTNFLSRKRCSPEALTVCGMLLSVVAGVLAGFGDLGFSGVVFLTASLMDAMDGAVARAQGRATSAGSVLDSVADRISEMALYSGLLIFFRFDVAAMGIVLCALCGSILVSYSSAKCEIFHVIPRRGFMRRAERALFAGIGLLSAPIEARFFTHAENPHRYFILLSILLVIGIGAGWTAFRRTQILIAALKQAGNPK